MRTRIAFLLVVPVWIVLMLLAAMSGECGGGGSCVATVRVGDDRYAVSISRGMTIDESELTAYRLATRLNTGSKVIDNQTYQLGTIDPTKVLVMKLAPSDPDAGAYLLLVDFDDSAAWDLTCPYFRTADPGRPEGCR